MSLIFDVLKKNKQKIIIPIVITVILFFIFFIVIQYNVKGETNIPFHISKLMVVSTATGVQKTDSANLWDLDINQNNDVYININKNEEYKSNAIIKTITMENFSILTNPEVGEISIYRPAQEGLYKDLEEYHITEKLEYVGSSEADIKNLKIANQGGLILFRLSNRGIGEYISNEVQEVNLGGSLIKEIGVTLNQIKAKLSFDLIIETTDEFRYKTTIILDLPVGDLLEEETSSMEKTDFSDVIFKRI